MKRINMFFQAARLSFLEYSVAIFAQILNRIYRRQKSLSGAVTVFLYRSFEKLVRKTDKLEIGFVMKCLEQ